MNFIKFLQVGSVYNNNNNSNKLGLNALDLFSTGSHHASAQPPRL